MSDEKQPEKPTVELPAVPPWAIELTREVRGARADIGLVSNDLGVVKDRLLIVEKWKGEAELRASRTSERVREGSQHDMERDAKVAGVIVWQRGVDEKLGALDTKIDTAASAQTEAIVAGVRGAVTDALSSAAKNPTLRKLGIALVGLALVAIQVALSYLTRHM